LLVASLLPSFAPHAQNKKAYEKESNEINDGSSYNSVIDCIHYKLNSNHNIVIAASDYSISFWKYEPAKRTITWYASINCEFMQRCLLYIPPTQHVKAAIISAGVDRTLSLWDINTKKRRYHADLAHKDTITILHYVPHLGLVISASIDKNLKLWDVETLRSRGKHLHHGEPVKSVCNNSDKLITCGPCCLVVWEFQSMSEILRYTIPTNTHNFVKSKMIHYDDLIHGPQLRVLTADTAGLLKFWTISSNATAGDGKCDTLFSVQCKLTLGTLLDFTTAVPVAPCPWPPIYVCGSGRETQMFTSKRVKKKHVTINYVNWCRSGRSLVTIEGSDVRAWDVNTGNENMIIPNAFTNEVTCITSDQPLNRKLYIGDSSGTISIFNSFSGSKLSSRQIHKGAISKIVFDPYNKHIITMGNDRMIRVLSETEGELEDTRHMIDAHTVPIVEGDYCWRSSLLATVAGEEIKLWDFQDLQVRQSEERSVCVGIVSHARSYFRARRASSLTTAIILTHDPNPFRNSLC